MNKTEEKLFTEGKLLPVIEQFYTLQGEGYHTGKAAYFIRLGGCDIGCEWCDTKFSWMQDLHQLVDTDDIVRKVSSVSAKAIVVTGGEPSQYNLSYLCNELKSRNFDTFIETAGTNELTGSWDWICLSPKRNSPPVNSILEKADELKVVVQSEEDLKWAELNANKVTNSCKLYLQPEWSRYKTIINTIVEYIKQNPKWCVSLQAHKFMRIP